MFFCLGLFCLLCCVVSCCVVLCFAVWFVVLCFFFVCVVFCFVLLCCVVFWFVLFCFLACLLALDQRRYYTTYILTKKPMRITNPCFESFALFPTEPFLNPKFFPTKLQ